MAFGFLSDFPQPAEFPIFENKSRFACKFRMYACAMITCTVPEHYATLYICVQRKHAFFCENMPFLFDKHAVYQAKDTWLQLLNAVFYSARHGILHAEMPHIAMSIMLFYKKSGQLKRF